MRPETPPVLLPHITLEFCHFLMLDSRTPPGLEESNSIRWLHTGKTIFHAIINDAVFSSFKKNKQC